ncbi:MAG TPA: hypothetical protein VII06_28830 [Chloroflexota bacterium]|jgi:hypothetical protein
MAATQEPTHDEIVAFIGRLKEYGATLPESDQKLLRSMVVAALGLEKKEEKEEDVSPYWAAYVNPVGPAGGPGYGAAVATPYGGYGWNASPWGAAYRVW